MKLALAFGLLLSTSFASAGQITPGSFKASHDIGIMYANDAASCKENDGTWDAKEEFCLIKDAGDTMEIKARKNSKFLKIEITRVGTNFHTCDFQGVGVKQADGSIVAKAKSVVYNENGTETKTTCDLSIVDEKEGLNVSIINNKEEACSSFCGANMSLDGGGFIR